MSDLKTPRNFIREELYEEINSVVSNYFYTTYNKAQYPYAIVDIKELSNEVLTQYSLDISVYDKKEDTTEIETICDNLKGLLNQKRAVKDNYAYAIWFSNCLTDKEEDRTIKKRILAFEIHLFKFN